MILSFFFFFFFWRLKVTRQALSAANLTLENNTISFACEMRRGRDLLLPSIGRLTVSQ